MERSADLLCRRYCWNTNVPARGTSRLGQPAAPGEKKGKRSAEMSGALGSGSPGKIGLAIAAQLSLAACASFSPDGGMSTVQETAAVELGKDVVKKTSEFEAALVGDRVRELLGRSLTADAAVQI